MPRKIVTHVLYAIENTDMSSMPKIIIFYVLYVISVSFTVRGMDDVKGPSVGPCVSGRGGNPLLPHLLPTPAVLSLAAPPTPLRYLVKKYHYTLRGVSFV
jgi:hypothetical protein